MQANILDFNAELPEVIYWDTSFVLNFSIEGARYSEKCANFSRRLQRENIPSIISNLALDEIWYGLLRANLINDFSDKWLDKLRGDSTIINKYAPLLKNATRDLVLLPNVVFVEVRTEMTFKALDFIEKYSLLPRDAIHLATMLSLGIKNIVTTDVDFTKVDGINVYTCNPTAFIKTRKE